MKKVLIVLIVSTLAGGITAAKAQEKSKVATPHTSTNVLPIHDTRVADKNSQITKPLPLPAGNELRINTPVQPTLQQAPVLKAPQFIPLNPTPTELKVVADQEKLKAQKNK